MKTFRREACNIYLWGELLVVPVITGFLYSDISKTKEICFLLMFGVFLLCGLIAIIGGAAADRSMGIPRPSFRETVSGLSALDWTMICFGSIMFLSSVTSYFPLRFTLFGEFAQCTAGMVYLGLIISYFLLSRFTEAAKTGYIAAFYASSVFVLVLGLLNHMRIDPLGMHQYDNYDTLSFMAATIGNVDYYCGYWAVVLIFFAAYRSDMKQGWKATAVDALLVVCYMNMWTARASGGYFGILFGLFPLLLMGAASVTRLRGLFWQGVLAGIGGLAAEICNHFNPYMYYGIEAEMSGRFQLNHFWLPFGAVCLVLWLMLGKAEQDGRSEKVMDFLKKTGKPLTVVAVCIMVLLEGLILFYRPLQDLSGRTFIYDDLKRAFPLLTLREKIIGVGPGCMDLSLIHINLHAPEDMRFQTAHNEVFEFWYLTGIIGAAAYIAFVIAFFSTYYRALLGRIASSDGSEPECFREMCCFGAAFTAYLGQGLTNGPYVPVTVIAYILLAMFRRCQIPDENI